MPRNFCPLNHVLEDLVPTLSLVGTQLEIPFPAYVYPRMWYKGINK